MLDSTQLVAVGGYAFPGSSEALRLDNSGMTLRDYFAAKAMQAQLIRLGLSATNPELDSAFAYQVADAMLEERKKKIGGKK